MSVQNNLTERHQHILKATIKHYIATAEPVGSKTLIEEYDFSVSSATIRNIMGRLEKAGLLYQPYTSAGRVPSDEGYRIYVDQMISPNYQLQKKLHKYWRKQHPNKTLSVESLLQKAAKLLASISGYITLITIPQTTNHQLRHLQLLLTDSEQIILIVVTDSYQSQSFLIEPKAERFTEAELQIISNFLNYQLKGRSLTELGKINWQDFRELQKYSNFLTQLFSDLIQQLRLDKSYPLIIHGISELLRQPEFSQPETTQMLIELLEQQQEDLWPLLFPGSSPMSNVKIRIGTENDLEPMRKCSIVSSVYYKGSLPVGSVAIIGPTRMLYENVISLVDSAATYLSQVLTGSA